MEVLVFIFLFLHLVLHLLDGYFHVLDVPTQQGVLLLQVGTGLTEFTQLRL